MGGRGGRCALPPFADGRHRVCSLSPSACAGRVVADQAHEKISCRRPRDNDLVGQDERCNLLLEAGGSVQGGWRSTRSRHLDKSSTWSSQNVTPRNRTWETWNGTARVRRVIRGGGEGWERRLSPYPLKEEEKKFNNKLRCGRSATAPETCASRDCQAQLAGYSHPSAQQATQMSPPSPVHHRLPPPLQRSPTVRSPRYRRQMRSSLPSRFGRCGAPRPPSLVPCRRWAHRGGNRAVVVKQGLLV